MVYVLLALLTLAVAGCDSGGSHAVSEPDPRAAEREEPPRLFSPESVWNERLGSRTRPDPRSRALVNELLRQVSEEREARHGPWIGIGKASTPIYRVSRDQRAVEVELDSKIPKGPSRAFAAVPLPADARPADGPDAQLTVWQPASDRLWEFFGMSRQADGWHARWGGAIDRVSHSVGYFTSDAWPGARWYWGATATSLPIAAGVMTVEELRRGRIEHALALNLKRVRAGVFSWPAQRSDGETEHPDAIPEGARFRLDPKLDIASLRLPRATEGVALAAQRYGLIVRDKSSTVALYAEDPAPYRRDPYPAILGPVYPGDVGRLLDRFPWHRLQLVRMRLCGERTQRQLAEARDRGTGECLERGGLDY
ncbi:MAG: hypothetical protein ACRDLY_09745 [Thermoleophilaceae bacterium]